MLGKYTIAGLAGSVLLASVAFAQTPTATSDSMKAGAASDTTSATSSSFQGDWRASKMVGLSVYNDKNESVGSINDMLTDKTGNIKAVIIGVGGFLGVGEHLVAVPFDKVKFVNEPVAYTPALQARRDVGTGRRVGSAFDYGRGDHCGCASGKHDAPRGEAQSLVSGSRRVQRDQG